MIFLIEKIWIDPMDNHHAVGYNPIGYFEGTEQEASEYCHTNGRIYTKKDCWEIQWDMGLNYVNYV